MNIVIGFFLISISLFSVTDEANVLGVFPVSGRSHWVVYESLMKALAARGHNVTVITSYPQKLPLSNYTDIDVSAAFPSSTNKFSIDLIVNILSNTHSTLTFIAKKHLEKCQKAIQLSQVQALLKSELKFDVVFTEIFGSDCDVGYAHYYKAPLISMMSSGALPWSYDRVGGPDNPSYIPVITMPFSGKMDFIQRLKNTISYIYFKIVWKVYSEWPADKFLKQTFGPETPYINDILYNTSMVFVNNHFSIDGSRPLVPNMVEIGGIHIKPPQPIPKEILKFIEESPNGVIYFTFGSMIRISSFPKKIIQIFKDVFAQLPIRVLWKFEEKMPDKPSNVFISNWMPQRDILNHSKVRLLMTHGGLLGILEAVHSGVPIVGIPFFFDQFKNIQNIAHNGAGISLDYHTLTRKSLFNALNSIITNTSYSANAKKLSQRFLDRPLNSTETAVYWTEYVIRHKGASHLRTAAVGMPWWKYFLVDVIAFITLIIFIFSYVIYFLLKTVHKKISKKSFSNDKKTN